MKNSSAFAWSVAGVLIVAMLVVAWASFSFNRLEAEAVSLLGPPLELHGGAVDEFGAMVYAPLSPQECYRVGETLAWRVSFEVRRAADVRVRQWVKVAPPNGVGAAITIEWPNEAAARVAALEPGATIRTRRDYVIPLAWPEGDYFVLVSALADSQASVPVRYRVPFRMCGD